MPASTTIKSIIAKEVPRSEGEPKALATKAKGKNPCFLGPFALPAIQNAQTIANSCAVMHKK
jgi:hypothetical protein